MQDDNLLCCSREHIIKVFDMLRRQPKPAIFDGGIEAKLLEPWHVELFDSIRIGQIFFAYDTEDDWDPLVKAKSLMPHYNRHKLFCYVLIGYTGDTIEKARDRLVRVKALGICPFAMLYRDNKGYYDTVWRSFQREWCRPGIIYAKQTLDMEKVSE